MKDLTNDLVALFKPTSALVFYQRKDRDEDTYVEHFDMDTNGTPINAHPLTVREAEQLAEALNTKDRETKNFLKSKGILPRNILHINAHSSKVIWFTKAQARYLHFADQLEIPSGMVSIPPLLWVADKTSLNIYALDKDRRPTENATLYNAPFFNIYRNGNVCMGTVDINNEGCTSLEEFTSAWEDYFFNSYFSHLMNGHNPTKGNCVSLLKSLVNTGKAFPKDALVKNEKQTIKNLIR